MNIIYNLFDSNFYSANEFKWQLTQLLVKLNHKQRNYFTFFPVTREKNSYYLQISFWKSYWRAAAASGFILNKTALLCFAFFCILYSLVKCCFHYTLNCIIFLPTAKYYHTVSPVHCINLYSPKSFFFLCSFYYSNNSIVFVFFFFFILLI